jgi:anti-sigma-K factor RskA
MTVHIDPDDLALYALQSLSAEEAATIAGHLRGCAVCRSEVAALHGDLAALALTAQLYAPPERARQRLVQQIGRERKAAPTGGAAEQELDGVERGAAPNSYRKGGRTNSAEDERGRQARGRGAWWLLCGLGWAVAAGGFAVAGSLYQQREAMRSSVIAANDKAALVAADRARGQELIDALSAPGAMRVMVTQRSGGSQGRTGQPEASGRAIYVPGRGTLVFLASNLEPLPQEKTYALWLIRADGRNPVPAGSFRPDARGDASVILPPLPKGIIARAFVVTVEEASGSAQPTLPILLSGALI